jgi:hypothetical protein
MEKNNFEDVVGVVPVADIPEGRFVLITAHSFSYDFGSRTDLVGAKVPATADEAKKAKYCITFSPDNRATPFYEQMPSMDWAMRGGWSQAANTPFSATVFLTHKDVVEGLVLPSGIPALAYTDGVFTIPSGGYVYDTNIIVKGASLIVADATTDGAGSAGKLKYSATFQAGVVGTTEEFDASTGKLTVRID